MLDFKIILIYIFISSIAYRFILFPKKIMTLRGFQLSLILAYNALLVTNVIEFQKTTFFISILLYFTFVFYPQWQAKNILKMLMIPNRESDKPIENKLKVLFILTVDLKALKSQNGIIEYFLKTIRDNSVKKENPAVDIKTIVKRKTTDITYLFMIIIVAMFSLTYTENAVQFQFNLIKYGGNFNELVKNGEYFRLFTSIFLHGGTIHLLMNGFALFYLGMFVERIAKTRSYYFSIFIIGGVLASMSSFFLAKQNSVGASGAIFALIGALFSIIWLSKDNISKEFRMKVLRDIVFIIVINIALGLSIKNVDNYAHMGGLVSGLVITYFLYKLNYNILFKIFDFIAILLTIYGSVYFYNSLKNSYPEKISFTKEIQISNVKFNIPQDWEEFSKDNASSFQDLFFTRFILEDINSSIYNKSEYISKEVIKKELKNKKIISFNNTSFKVNGFFIRLIKFQFEFDKKLNDIRVGRIYFFKYKDIYFRFMVIFFKESYNKYGDIMTNFLEFNLER